MFERVSPLFHLFEKQFGEAKVLLSGLGKNFRSKKALELEEKLFFISTYLHVLNKIHFEEERLRFESFEPFKVICKSLKRIHHYKLAATAFQEEKGKTTYATYENFLLAEKKAFYRSAYEMILSWPPDMWEVLYAAVYDHTQVVKPLMVDIATRKLIDEELACLNDEGMEMLDTKAIREIMDGLQIITVVENMKVGVGLSPVFTAEIHQEMKLLLQMLTRWNQSNLFAQHLNFFLSDHEQVGSKYLDLAKSIKEKKKRLTTEVASLSRNLFTKLTV